MQKPAQNVATLRGVSWAGCGSAQAAGDDWASDGFFLEHPHPDLPDAPAMPSSPFH